jgi:hypothetical protein
LKLPTEEGAIEPLRLAPQSEEPSETSVGTVEEVATDQRKLLFVEALEVCRDMVDEAQDMREGPAERGRVGGEPGRARRGRDCALEEEAFDAVDCREKEENVLFDIGTDVG